MSPSAQVLAQDIVNFGRGIYLLIGILVFSLFGGIVALAAYVGIRAWIFQVRQRRSHEAYLKRTRRADGKNYPPQGFGACDRCGRFRKVTYFLSDGQKLCHDCYEVWWPVAERKPEPSTEPAQPPRHAEASNRKAPPVPSAPEP